MFVHSIFLHWERVWVIFRFVFRFFSFHFGSIIIAHGDVPFTRNRRSLVYGCVCMCAFVWVLELREIVMLSNRLWLACSHAFDLNGRPKEANSVAVHHSHTCINTHRHTKMIPIWRRSVGRSNRFYGRNDYSAFFSPLLFFSCDINLSMRCQDVWYCFRLNFMGSFSSVTIAGTTHEIGKGWYSGDDCEIFANDATQPNQCSQHGTKRSDRSV